MSTLFDVIEPASISWQDNSPYSAQFDDIYFSQDNGLLETAYVFIEGNDLPSRWQALQSQVDSQFVIGETGFGTGLNFLVTWQAWRQFAPKHARLHYISCEKHPLSRDDLARCLALWPSLSREAKLFLNRYPVLTPGMHHLQFETEQLSLTLLLGDATDMYRQLLVCGDHKLEAALRPWSVDAWFLDGFAPSKNNNMWHDALLKTVALLSKKNTTLSTYSSAAMVKAGLTKYGFEVHKIKGYGQKRHMLKANFDHTQYSLTNRETPWFVSQAAKITQKRAIVVGAGLSGALCAHAFAERGYQVDVLEQCTKPAQGASGNPQAVLFPNLSAFLSPLTELMLSGFLYAARRYLTDLNEGVNGAFQGLLQLLYNAKEEKSALSLLQWLSHYPELARYIDASQASAIAGIEINVPALYVPLAGWLDLPQLCARLLEHPNIHFKANTKVNSLYYSEQGWQVAGHQAPIVVVASGWASSQLSQLKGLPINAIGGQMSAVCETVQSRQLRVPICAASHVLPASQGLHYFGASYHLGDEQGLCKAVDNRENLNKLNALPIEKIWSGELSREWAGVRGAMPNYLPMVGPVPMMNEFKARFDILKKSAKYWHAEEGAYYPGLYVCAGFGSRGLTTAALCAQWLVSSINGEPSMLPRHLIKAIAPARFIVKDLVRAKI